MSRRAQLVAVAIVALLLVAVVVSIIVVLNSGDDPGAAADPGTTSTAGANPSEELPAGGILDGAGGSSAAEPAEPVNEDALRGLIPLDFNATNCTPTDRPSDDGSLAALTCGPSISPGANASEFFLYGSVAELEAAFQAYVQARFLEELPSGDAGQCGSAQGFGEYSQGGPVVGDLACYVDSESTAIMAWTNIELDVFAITSAAAGDESGLRELYDWWIVRGQITRR